MLLSVPHVEIFFINIPEKKSKLLCFFPSCVGINKTDKAVGISVHTVLKLYLPGN